MWRGGQDPCYFIPSHLVRWPLQLPLGSTKLRLETSRLQHDDDKVKVIVSVILGARTNRSRLQMQNTLY